MASKEESKAKVLASLPILVASCALWANCTLAAPVESPAEQQRVRTEVTRLLGEANKALAAGNINLALIQLKNAVRLAPSDGEARAQLGVALLRSGEAAAAERELRQARVDSGSYETVVPALLRAMLERKEINELLRDFPDPPQGTEDKATADVLVARSMALQASNQPKEARAAMDRSLVLRRDPNGLVASSRLAQAQGDLALAHSQIDETLKLSPTHEGALSDRVVLAREAADTQKALASADEFVKRVPESLVARALRIEVLLDLNQDARARLDLDVLLKLAPKSAYGSYYRGLLMARTKDFKSAWAEVQKLEPEFVQSQPSIAQKVAGIAVASGNAESGGAILTTLLAHHPENRFARLQLASLRLNQMDSQAALDVLAPLKASDDPAVHALLAQAFIGLRRFDEAIPSLEITNSSPSANALLKRQLALAQLQVGKDDNAIKGLSDLLQSDPGNVQLVVPLIAALGKASKWDDALAVADGMAKQAPTSPLAPFFRGQVLSARGNFAAAASEFGKALALDPKFVPALYLRANVLVLLGKQEEAKNDLQLILAQNPANELAYVRLAEIALNNGLDSEALAILDRAIRVSPNDPTPRLALANYQIKQAKYEDAQVTVKELLRISQSNPEALVLQGQIQLRRGQLVDAITTFRALATSNPSSPGAHALLARALFVSKDRVGAEDAAKRAVELAPNSAQLRMELIDIEISAGKGEDALATARQYASATPGTDADLVVADTLLRLNRISEAEAFLDKSLKARPDWRIVTRLSEIAMNAQNVKKAGAIVRNWIARNPNDFESRKQYAAMLIGLGDVASARKEYETLLKQHPDDPIILNNLSWLVQKDDPDRALSLASHALKIAPQSAEVADTLGWMKYQRRDHQEALYLLQRAHGLDGDSASISYHLARVLDATGNRTEAKALLRVALANNQKFDGADEAAQLLARW